MALPYVAVLTVMTFLVAPYLKKDYSIENKQRKFVISTEAVLVFLAYLIYIVFAVSKSFMPGKGANDAYAYYLNFTRAGCSLKYFMTEVTTFEPGYSLIVWIVRQVTSEYRFMLWIWHTLSFILIVGFYKKVYLKTNYLFSVFVGLMSLMSQFNTLRMSISVSIALYSLISMYEKRWIKALIIILCAVSMHITALIMLPVLMVVFVTYNRNNYKKSLVVILIALGIILAVGMLGLINRIALGTAKSVYVGQSSIAWGTDLAIIVFSILCFAKFRQLKQLAGINEIFMVALPVGIICIPFQWNMSMMYRMLLYFLPVIFALIPSVVKCYNGVGESKIKSIAVVVISYGYLFSQIFSFITEGVVYLNKYIT